jgi:manganese-dependent inorganic pyrophosphatase
MKTYVIGHLKPDTDSVVAAMALANLYQNVSCFGYSNVQAAITEKINGETSFLMNKFGLNAPALLTASDLASDDQVVLVDHNEESQRLVGLNPNQIVEIVDHHKANLNFEQPIYLTFKTWGSSNTIVYSLMKENDFVPDQKLASLMLAAILSDTVGFKSVTCTVKDKEVALELAAIADIQDLEAFTLEIFKAKSDVSKLSTEEIVKNDYKIFDFAGQKVMIDQLETVEQDSIIANKKTALLEAMGKVKAELKADMIFVAITDILKVNTKLLILDDVSAQVAEKAFGGEVIEQVLDIGAALSRKKEIAPPIERALTQEESNG